MELACGAHMSASQVIHCLDPFGLFWHRTESRDLNNFFESLGTGMTRQPKFKDHQCTLLKIKYTLNVFIKHKSKFNILVRHISMLLDTQINQKEYYIYNHFIYFHDSIRERKMIAMPSINHQGDTNIISTSLFFTNVVKWQVLIEFLNTKIILMQKKMLATKITPLTN